MKRLVPVLLLASFWVTGPACAAANLAAADIAGRVGFDQHLNAPIPPDLRFRDETGTPVRLGAYFGTSPLVLVFAYYGCSTLCPTVLGHLAATLDRGGPAPGAGYQVIVASIDPGDSPAVASARKAVYLPTASRPQTGKAWHLLTGSQASIAALARVAGFRYAYDAATHQYAHPAGIVVLTPRGTIARYFFGFDFTPAELRTALDAAAAQRIASPVQRLLLLCFHFDPAGKYSATVMQALRWMALATLLALAAMLAAARWRRRAAGASPR
ncbi:MAG: SCO family protein [Casimicrobiaceae bacterium]